MGPFPVLARPKALTVVPAPGDADSMITLQTLQGVLAQTTPRLYINGGSSYGQWLQEIHAAGVPSRAGSDVWSLLASHAP